MAVKSAEFDLDRIDSILSTGNRAVAEKYINGLPSAERARLLSRMDDEPREKLFSLLSAEFAADLLQSLGEAQSVEILESVDPELAASVVDLVPSDEQADLLTGCDEEVAEKILEAMSPEEASDARDLMQYGWHTAGGMMITEFLAFRELATVQEVTENMRENRDRYADFDIQYVYVTSGADRLLGVLRLRDLVLAHPEDTVTSMMIGNPLSVEVETPLHDLHQLFQDHHFLGLPVVDSTGKLLGVLQRSAVEESMGEEATENYLKASGLVSSEELRTMPLLKRVRGRLPWLSINIVLNAIAASIIAINQDVLEQLVVLAVFLPIISDMSGCSGNQAVGVSVRELTLGLVKPREVFRVFLKELSIGTVNGLVLGLLVGTAGTIYQGNVWFGVVVGSALMLNTIVSVLIGGSVPLILKGLKKDPALASAPILTTITDMCGFFFVLTFASILMSRLV
ncbi:MAG: magnesium transporter [Verrucomicrobiota bacterium]